ncbi:MAG: lipid-A-disaccharide synthase [Gammaproteobacteria bacterium]|nr:lipid-A-disaccharide synthase [Gammaproteobacteria bacterium]MBK80133.1 lipid-A-disaccharide synthase [Gammaproteobacteria bacterium]
MKPATIGILAGEASGDNLGRGLMAALKARHGDVRFVGVGGPGMAAEGLESLAGMDELAVNGFVDPIRRLPALLRLLRHLIRRFDAEQPAVFVGVDFNVFNLLLERRLKRRGIPTVHYVSPSVYAWRRGRIRRIARAADMLLTLYPFEPELYRGTPVRAVYVGHPLADAIAPDDGGAAGRLAARQRLALPAEATVIALLPGSRMSEVRLMGPVFLDAAERIAAERPGCRFVVPCVRPAIDGWLRAALAARPALPLTTYQGDAREALTACDAALVKSGTSTLEAMLLRRPMVVSYRLGALTYRLVRGLLRTPHVALPNILAGRRLVPELLQDEATPAALATTLLAELDKSRSDPEYLQAFARLHGLLRRDADAGAADAVSTFLVNQEDTPPSS